MKSIAFFQGQSTGEEEVRVSRKGKGMMVNKQTINKISGDIPVDPEVMSNWSVTSEQKLKSVLWQCK